MNFERESYPVDNLDQVSHGKIELPKGLNERVRTRIDEYHDIVVYGFPKRPLKGLEHIRVVIQDSKNRDNVLDFGQLLKDGDKTVEVVVNVGERFEADIFYNELHIPPDSLHDPKEVFAILHELGHINDRIRKAVATPKEYHELAISRSGLRGQLLANEDAVLQKERDAWAEAIKLARRIRRENEVDLFKLFGNMDEFMGWFRVASLRSYEEALVKSGHRGYTKEKQVEIWSRKQQHQEWLAMKQEVSTDIAA